MIRISLCFALLVFGFSIWQAPPAHAQSDPRTIVCPPTDSIGGTLATLEPKTPGSSFTGSCGFQDLDIDVNGADTFGNVVTVYPPCNRPATVECFAVYHDIFNYQLRFYLPPNATDGELETANATTITLPNTGGAANIYDCYTCTVTVRYTYDNIERTTTIKVQDFTKWPHIISDVGTNTAPAIHLSQGSDLVVPENQTQIVDIEAIDDIDTEGAGLTYELTSGADASLFEIDPDTGLLTFLTQPTVASRGDFDNNNIYELEVTVLDSEELSDTESITIQLVAADSLMPTLESVSISSNNLDPQTAKSGDTITVTFTSAEQLHEASLSATIAGETIATAGIRRVYTGSADSFTYAANLLVDDTTRRGLVEFNISNIVDLVGNRSNNVTGTTDGSSVTIGVSAEEKQRVIADFVVNRMNNMLNNQPDITSFINGSGAANVGGGPLGFLGFNADNQGYTTHFSTSLGYVWQQHVLAEQSLALATETVEQPDSGDISNAAQLTEAQKRGYDLWMQVNGAYSETGDADASLWLGYLGGHVFVNPDFLVGGLVQLDWASETSEYLGSSVEGFGWMVGPYFAAKVPGQNVYFDARAAWGQSANNLELDIDGTDDDFDTERWLVSAKLSGAIAAIDWTIRPMLSASYIEETQKEYTDDFNQIIGEQVFSLGEVRFGPSFTYEIVHDGVIIRPSFGLTGVWNFSVQNGVGGTANTLGSEELRARMDAGLTVLSSSAWSLEFRGYFDGLGIDDYEAYGGTAKLSAVFH